ncbi:MAG: chemotaxis protein CheW, partial [Saprospiraceae bacterium]|nr:chemotaxis protein CheW [Saprospiraceae bacterium]
AILGEIEARCREAATALPRKEIKQGTVWAGITFRLGTSRMIAPLADVVEILTYPELSYVPNTCYWVRGIANIRGNLLPVADLNAYLFGSLTQVTFRTRVLVVDCDGVYSGVVVDDVMGLRYLREDAFVAEIPDMDEPLRPYVNSGCRVDDEVWGIFNLFSLIESPDYLKTAV